MKTAIIIRSLAFAVFWICLFFSFRLIECWHFIMFSWECPLLITFLTRVTSSVNRKLIDQYCRFNRKLHFSAYSYWNYAYSLLIWADLNNDIKFSLQGLKRFRLYLKVLFTKVILDFKRLAVFRVTGQSEKAGNSEIHVFLRWLI